MHMKYIEKITLLNCTFRRKYASVCNKWENILSN